MPSTDRHTDQNQEPDTCFKKRTGVIILLNILMMFAVGSLLVFVSMIFLKFYTRHNDSVVVPTLTGLSQQEATTLLQFNDLGMEVIDSVYNETMAPGVILESVPKSGSSVKRSRTIYVTVNTTIVRQSRIPEVYEISRRQAEAALRRAGFINIREEYVPGVYSDLATAVKDGNTGVTLLPGSSIAYNHPIILQVTSTQLMDSLSLAQQNSLDSLIQDEVENARSQNSDNGNGWF